MNPFWVVIGPRHRDTHSISAAVVVSSVEELRALDPAQIGGIACAEDIALLGDDELVRLAAEVFILRTVWPEIRFRTGTTAAQIEASRVLSLR